MKSLSYIVLSAFTVVAILCGGLLYSEKLCFFASVLLIATTIFENENKVNKHILIVLLMAFIYSFVMIFLGVNSEESVKEFIKYVVYVFFFIFASGLADSNKTCIVFFDTIAYSGIYCMFINLVALIMGVLPEVDGIHAFSLVIPYSNTLAVFFCVGTVWSFYRKNFIVSAINFVGFILCFSFIMYAVFVFCLTGYFIKSRKKRLAISGGFLCCIGAAFAITMPMSSILERILYYKDTIRILLDYPFGTGAGGFSSLQMKYQTGRYAVRYVHSSLFQAIADGGIVGIVLFVATVYLFIRFYINSKSKHKHILLLINSLVFIHSLVDVDTQFPIIIFIYIISAISLSKKSYKVKYLKPIAMVLCVVAFIEGISVVNYIKGHEKYLQGDKESAIVFLQRAVFTDRKNASAYYLLGQLTMDAEYFEQAIKIDGYNPKYYSPLCAIYKDEKKIYVCEKICELQPLNFDYYVLLSELLLEKGDYNKVLLLNEKYEKAIRKISRIEKTIRPDSSYEMPQKLRKNIQKARNIVLNKVCSDET